MKCAHDCGEDRLNRTLLSPPRKPPRPAALRLGERLRQLRVAAGLTQTDSPATGSRRSTSARSSAARRARPETIEWLAARLGVDAGYLANGVATDERGRAEAMLARAEALTGAPLRRGDRRVRAVRSAVAATGAGELEVRASPARRGVGCSGRGPARARAARARAAVEERELLGSRSRRGPVPARRLPLLSSISTAMPSSTRREASPSARRSRPICSAPTSSPGAPAATAASATTRRRARTSSAPSSWPSRWTMRRSARSYFQASLVAERDGHWVLARTYAERAKASTRS